MDVIVAAAIALFIIVLTWELLKKVAFKLGNILLNSVAGLLILLFLNVLLGWDMPISVVTLGICGLFGIPGVGSLIILRLFGMI